MSGRKEEKKDVPGPAAEHKSKFAPEDVEELRKALGLQDVPAQIKALLETRDQKLLHDIKIEMAKASVHGQAGPAAGSSSPGQAGQAAAAQNSIGIIGDVAKSIIQELKGPQQSGDMQVMGQIVGIALDNMRLSNQWMHKQLFGKIEPQTGA